MKQLKKKEDAPLFYIALIYLIILSEAALCFFLKPHQSAPETNTMTPPMVTKAVELILSCQPVCGILLGLSGVCAVAGFSTGFSLGFSTVLVLFGSVLVVVVLSSVVAGVVLSEVEEVEDSDGVDSEVDEAEEPVDVESEVLEAEEPEELDELDDSLVF